MDSDIAKGNYRAKNARDLGGKLKTKRYPAVVNRWALIVGISKYQHSEWDLEFAHADAMDLSKFIQTAAGGRFESDKIVSLINEHATTAELTKGLRSFLKQPDRDDIVLLYFACHGAPDPDRPENIYLLTHDADPDDISGTAVPMREIQLALMETLNAERVVMLADTCHSGRLASGRDRRLVATEAGVMNTYLQELSESRGGVALLTSAEANETSQEDKKWGGGHGVFTHFLLEGMRGAADGYGGRPRDGRVAVRELFEYVRDRVKAATKVQHPVIGPQVFDDNLPMAVTGEINAREYCELAKYLEQLAKLLDEPQRFRAAAAQFNEAIELARAVGSQVADEELGRARSLLAAGDVDEAANALRKLTARDKSNSVPLAHFYLGIAEAKKHRYEEAQAAFQTFLRISPHDENAAWVKEYSACLIAPGGGRRVALLIGINKYQLGRLYPLTGCVNDVRILGDTLIRRAGFRADDVTLLCDEQATHQNILAALATLRTSLKPEDQVWVSYSGHSIPESHRDAFGIDPSEELYLVVHDTIEQEGCLRNGIAPEELHRVLKDIPARHKTLVLDTHPNSRFIRLAESDGDYALLLASDTAEMSEEIQVDIEGSPQTMGLFTAALTRCLSKADPQSLTYGDLLDSAIGYIHERERASHYPGLRPQTVGERGFAYGKNAVYREPFEQTPLLLGDRDRPVFAAEDIYLWAFEFSQRRNYAALSPESIERRYRRVTSHLMAPFHEFHYSVGRALTKRGYYATALVALQTGLEQSSGDSCAVAAALAHAQLGAHHDSDARTTVQQYLASASAEVSVDESVLTNMDILITGRRHALLVGISNYNNPAVTPVAGAVNDALLMKKVLQERWQFRETDITMLKDGEASRKAIIDEFRELCGKAHNESAFFYFSGNGSLALDSAFTLVSADGRCDEVFDISVEELGQLAQKTSLVTVLDARTVAMDERRFPETGGLIKLISPLKDLRIGAITVYADAALPLPGLEAGPLEIQALPKSDRPPLLSEEAAVHGKLTYALARALLKDWEETPTYQEWLNAATDDIGHPYPLMFEGVRDISREQLFDNFAVRAAVIRELEALEYRPIQESISTLLRLIEQHQQQGDSYPHGWLNLGAAYYAIGDYDKAINALKRAVNLYEDESNFAQEGERYPQAEEFRCEAHYQLGRALYVNKRDLTRAVDELSKALACNPENPHVLYHLGQAVREMVERETFPKAETVFKKYLEKGAPLGHEDEVRKFLGSRDRQREEPKASERVTSEDGERQSLSQ